MFMFNSTHRRLVQGFKDEIAEATTKLTAQTDRAKESVRRASAALAERDGLQARLTVALHANSAMDLALREIVAKVTKGSAPAAKWMAARAEKGLVDADAAGQLAAPTLGRHEAN